MQQVKTLKRVIADLEAQQLLSPTTTTAQIIVAIHPLESASTPWFIHLLVGMSAWLAALLLLFFFFLAELVTDSTSAMTVGLLLMIGTIFLYRSTTQMALFLSQLILVLNLTGQVLLVGGIFQETDITTAALIIIPLEILLIIIYPDHLLRFLAVLATFFSMLVLCDEWQLTQAIHLIVFLAALGASSCWLWEAHHQTTKMASLYQPLGYGFSVALQLVLLFSIMPHNPWLSSPLWGFSTAGLTLLVLLLAYRVLQAYQVALSSPITYVVLASILLIALLLYPAPGVMAALLVMVLGFQRGNSLLMGLAVMSLSVFFITYYYHLHISLWMKSLTLMSAGLTLLILRISLKRMTFL